MSVLLVRIPVLSDFTEAVNHMKPLFKEIKNSLSPWGTYYSFYATGILPYNLPTYLSHFISDKVTFMWSNLAGLTKAMKFAGTN